MTRGDLVIRCLGVGSCALVVLVGGMACAVDVRSNLAEIETGLMSTEYRPRVDAHRKVLEQRKQLVDTLLRLAKGEPKPTNIGTKSFAIDLLGYLRAVEAIDFLIKNIEGGYPPMYLHVSRTRGSVCVEALARIGYPSVRAILGPPLLTASKGQLHRYGLVLTLVCGEEAARELVRLHVKSTQSRELREALEQLLKSM